MGTLKKWLNPGLGRKSTRIPSPILCQMQEVLKDEPGDIGMTQGAFQGIRKWAKWLACDYLDRLCC